MHQLIQIDSRTTHINALVETIVDKLAEESVCAALEACDLQPLTSTLNHAAIAAVNVLLAADGPKAPAAPPADSTSPGALPTRKNGHKPQVRQRRPKSPPPSPSKKPKVGEFQCPHCLATLTSQKRLDNHLRGQHSDIAGVAS